MKKIRLNGINYACAVAWLVVSAIYMFARHDTSMGVTFFCIGMLWLCIGRWNLGKINKKESAIDYYNRHARVYCDRSKDIDVMQQRKVFESYLAANAHILDWGCGCGRDAAAFANDGYVVDAVDGSIEICRIASERIGMEVKCQTYDKLNAEEVYDGIWACASIIHMDRAELIETLKIARRALKPGGVMYACFIAGSFEGEKFGVYYINMDDGKLASIIGKVPGLKVMETWLTSDCRGEDKRVKWYNVILKKEDPISESNV